MDRLKYLMERRLNGEGSDEEYREMLDLVASGQHDEAFMNTVEEMLDGIMKEGEPADETVAAGMRNALDKVLSDDRFVKTVPMRKPARTTWRWMAAAASITVFAIAGLWLFSQAPEQAVEQVVQQPVSFTGKQFVHLPDGSTVLLNENSELTYRESFGEENREVVLSGEGYFDIRHDPSKPFIVRTANNIITKVLGTAFNVKAGEDEIVVTVTRGKVEVGDGKQAYAQITPDQQIVVSTRTHEFVTKEIIADKEVAWKAKYLVLDDVTLQEAAATIGDYFDATVTIENSELRQCRISAAFLEGQDIEYVLKIVSGIRQADYKLEGDRATIDGGIGCGVN